MEDLSQRGIVGIDNKQIELSKSQSLQNIKQQFNQQNSRSQQVSVKAGYSQSQLAQNAQVTAPSTNPQTNLPPLIISQQPVMQNLSPFINTAYCNLSYFQFISQLLVRLNNIISNKSQAQGGGSLTSRQSHDYQTFEQIDSVPLKAIEGPRFPSLTSKANQQQQYQDDLQINYLTQQQEQIQEQKQQQFNQLVPYETKKKFHPMSLSLASITHLSDLRNVTAINFAQPLPSKPVKSFKDQMKEIKKQKLEKLKKQEEEAEKLMLEQKLLKQNLQYYRAGGGIQHEVLENTVEETMPQHHSQQYQQHQLLPIIQQKQPNSHSLQQQYYQNIGMNDQGIQQKNNSYKKLIKQKGEVFDEFERTYDKNDNNWYSLKPKVEKEINRYQNRSDRNSSSDYEEEEEEEEDDDDDFNEDQLQQQGFSQQHNIINVELPNKDLRQDQQIQQLINESQRLLTEINDPNTIKEVSKDEEDSNLGNQFSYQPYSLKEFSTNIGKGNYKKMGGLGPNIGSDQIKAKLKNEARMEFGNQLRLINQKNKEERIKFLLHKQHKDTTNNYSQNFLQGHEKALLIKNDSIKKLIDQNKKIQSKKNESTARARALKYAETIKKPSKSIELSEVVQERKNDSLEEERLDLDLKKMKATMENYKHLMAFQHI